MKPSRDIVPPVRTLPMVAVSFGLLLFCPRVVRVGAVSTSALKDFLSGHIGPQRAGCHRCASDWGIGSMCGITGWVDYERDLTGARPKEIAQAMTDTMSCRGPDDEGLWLAPHAAMGHRRLAIIDLAGGRQPMIAEDDGREIAVLTYSGEVYNFQELRDELVSKGHAFRTYSDTEVLLHAYLEWGEDLADHLNGMFAFAVWDTRDRAAHPGPRPDGDQAALLLPDAGRGAVRVGAEGDPGQPAGRPGGRRRRAARDARVREDAGERDLQGHVRGPPRPDRQDPP